MLAAALIFAAIGTARAQSGGTVGEPCIMPTYGEGPPPEAVDQAD